MNPMLTDRDIELIATLHDLSDHRPDCDQSDGNGCTCGYSIAFANGERLINRLTAQLALLDITEQGQERAARWSDEMLSDALLMYAPLLKAEQNAALACYIREAARRLLERPAVPDEATLRVKILASIERSLSRLVGLDARLGGLEVLSQGIRQDVDALVRSFNRALLARPARPAPTLTEDGMAALVELRAAGTTDGLMSWSEWLRDLAKDQPDWRAAALELAGIIDRLATPSTTEER